MSALERLMEAMRRWISGRSLNRRSFFSDAGRCFWFSVTSPRNLISEMSRCFFGWLDKAVL